MVLVYLSSRGVLARLIDGIIDLRGNTRREKSRSHTAMLQRLHEKEEETGHPAMYHKTTMNWDLQVTDQWLVNQIVSCGKAKAVAILNDERRAPLHYDELEALTLFGAGEGSRRARCGYWKDSNHLPAFC